MIGTRDEMLHVALQVHLLFAEKVHIMNRFGPLCCNVFIIVSQRGTASSSTSPKPLFKAPGCRASGRATVS